MDIGKIQFGVDLATSVSIFGAAITFLYGQYREGKRNRKVAMSSIRVKVLLDTIQKLFNMIEESNLDVNKIQSGAVEVDVNSLISHVNNILRFIHYQRTAFYAPWSNNNNEIRILDEMENLLRNWADGLHEASATGDTTKMKPFYTLTESLVVQIGKLSIEIERDVSENNI